MKTVIWIGACVSRLKYKSLLEVPPPTYILFKKKILVFVLENTPTWTNRRDAKRCISSITSPPSDPITGQYLQVVYDRWYIKTRKNFKKEMTSKLVDDGSAASLSHEPNA